MVNVTSGSGSHCDEQFGLAAGAGMAPYAVTKAAANALTRKLAAELTDMRVNAVDPGLTATAPGMAEMGARPRTRDEEEAFLFVAVGTLRLLCPSQIFSAHRHAIRRRAALASVR